MKTQLDAIVKEALKGERMGGFYLIGLAPETTKKIGGEVPMADKQEMRSLLARYDGKNYIAFLNDAKDGSMYWGVWQIVTRSTDGNKYATGKWQGYIKHTQALLGGN